MIALRERVVVERQKVELNRQARVAVCGQAPSNKAIIGPRSSTVVGNNLSRIEPEACCQLADMLTEMTIVQMTINEDCSKGGVIGPTRRRWR